jgi:hypothetical protein
MVYLSEKDNTLKTGKHISTSMSSALDLLIPNSIGIIFLSRVVYMCDMVTLRGRGNVLETRNHISTSMTSALDLLTPKFDREHLPPMGSPYV